jgi:hypothetical protein
LAVGHAEKSVRFSMLKKGRNVGNKEREINNETIIHKKIKIHESKR